MRRSANAIFADSARRPCLSVALPSLVVTPARCQPDALGEWYCAADPKRQRVVDNLGRVL